MKTLMYLFIPFLLYASPFDSNLLQIGAKIFPKVTLIEKGTKERIQTNVNLLIVTTNAYKSDAQRLSDIIDAQYDSTLSNHPLNISIVSPKEALEQKNIHGFILLLDPNDPVLLTLLEHAQRNKILTFSFDPELLQKGVAISLYIGRSVKPYINLSILKQTPFTFEYGFLKLSQPY